MIHRNIEYIFLGLYYGGITVMMLYNLFLFVALKDRAYGYYVSYLFFIGLAFFTLNGFGRLYIWPNSIYLFHNYAHQLLLNLGFLAGYQFARTFLKTGERAPWIDKYARGMMLLHFLAICLAFANQYELSQKLSLILWTAVSGLFIIGLIVWHRGYRSARYYVLAWGFYAVAGTIYMLSDIGIISSSSFALFSVQLGSGIEMILLSLALADRINILQTQKDEAQKLARETLQKSKVELEVKVTERTMELLKQKKRAEKATKLKNQFMSLVAHDLRSPLASVSSMLDMAEKSGDEKQHEKRSGFILRAKESCKGLLDMIEELLNVNRIESGEIELKRNSYKALTIIKYYVSPISHLADEKGINLVIDLPDSKEIYVDMELFGQVMQNLVSNAIKFCNRGETITVFAPEANGSVIAVKDSGIGMSEETRLNLFDSNVKTSKPGTANEKGHGLGLTMCKTIIDAHGGSIRVESKEGEGSVFYIGLPQE